MIDVDYAAPSYLVRGSCEGCRGSCGEQEESGEEGCHGAGLE
jgi:hypothetical protein